MDSGMTHVRMNEGPPDRCRTHPPFSPQNEGQMVPIGPRFRFKVLLHAIIPRGRYNFAPSFHRLNFRRNFIGAFLRSLLRKKHEAMEPSDYFGRHSFKCDKFQGRREPLYISP